MKWKKWLVRSLKWFFGILLTLVLSITFLLYILKDDIIDYAISEINKTLKTEVHVDEIDVTFWGTFPNLSLDFNKVFIQDPFSYATRSDTLLYTEQIRLKFNPMDIWNEKYHVKKIDIKPGTLQLKVDKTGAVNYDIFKESDSKEKTNFNLKLKAIHATGMRFSYSNKVNDNSYKTKVQDIHLVGNFTQDKFDIATEASFYIQRIQNGLVPFIINQQASTEVAIHIDQVSETFSINGGKLLLSGIPFDFDVKVDTNEVKLRIDANKIPLADLANKLAVKEVKTVSQLKGSGTGTFHLSFENKLLKDSYPKVDCQFSIDNGRLTEPTKGLTLRNIDLKGYYSTLKGRDKEELTIKNVSFQTISGPFSGNLAIRRFSKPSYLGSAKGSLDLEVIHALFKIPKIEELTGRVKVNTNFHLETVIENNEPVVEIVDGNGTALMDNVDFSLENDSRKFNDIYGNLILNRSEAVLEGLKVHIGESDMELNGTFNYIDQFLQDKHTLDVSVIAESKKINLKDFTNTIAGDPKTTTTNREWMLPTMINGNVKLNVDAIHMEKHIFTQINGEMNVGNRSISIQKLHGITGNATVRGTLAVVETSPEYFQLATNLSSKDIYFKPIFREWNNFDQTVIQEDNISGRAEAILDLKAPFDLQYGVLKDEIEAQIQMKIIGGQLKNVSTFTALTKDLKTTKTKMILKSREIDALGDKLNNIQFETLENTIFIKNSVIVIPKMEIKSSAIDITVDGKHKFNNDIDYKFAFRFRELKQKKDESEFGIVEDDGTGIKVFVRMYGNLDNPIIEWDKTSRKEDAKQNREEAKTEAISILKSELGLFKKDTTIKKYQPPKKDYEVLKIEFGKEEEVNPFEEKKKIEKEKKGLKKFGEKLKEKTKPDEKEEFTVD
ncbi:AsmA-like C-terminal region-containing protein [Fluviicola taffensis]|uniref:AsmA-like C-terminal region-containing protein n=1 Tax=Fluviicola taffensis TaxID=191579 RepID=UPI0031383F25